MKKAVAIFLCVFLVFSAGVTAYSGSSEPADYSGQTQESPEETVQEKSGSFLGGLSEMLDDAVRTFFG